MAAIRLHSSPSGTGIGLFWREESLLVSREGSFGCLHGFFVLNMCSYTVEGRISEGTRFPPSLFFAELPLDTNYFAWQSILVIRPSTRRLS